MSNAARPLDLPLPAGVDGCADPQFAAAVRGFARIFRGRDSNRRRVGGAGLAVRLNGVPVVDIWTGYADAERATPWTRDTGALLFSATKGIAATVIHRLADRGLLSYDAPVADYWPEFAANGKSRITVRQVLTHRAGLAGLNSVAHSMADILDHRLMERRLAAAAPDRLLGLPAYHAFTFGWLLAGIARGVTGKDMAELFQAEVAAPLGVDGLHLGLPPAGSGTVAAPLIGTHLRATHLADLHP
ncbi:MAG: beta-lactamase family protein, partial [Mycobacteriaceae bacterium]|nr:beta-lactamase family protein [Mycobacteriaceae bacterium]